MPNFLHLHLPLRCCVNDEIGLPLQAYPDSRPVVRFWGSPPKRAPLGSVSFRSSRYCTDSEGLENSHPHSLRCSATVVAMAKRSSSFSALRDCHLLEREGDIECELFLGGPVGHFCHITLFKTDQKPISVRKKPSKRRLARSSSAI